MSDMLIGKANFNDFNIGMKDFMQEYKNNVNDIQSGKQGAKLGEFPDLASENINMSEDVELAADYKLLTQNNISNALNENIQGTPIATNSANSFNKVLNNYINEVNQSQLDAENKTKLFASGGNIDVHSVMIASEKANLSMQLTMQMRNKLLQAYQEISRMQV